LPEDVWSDSLNKPLFVKIRTLLSVLRGRFKGRNSLDLNGGEHPGV
jgi:hypothetical protein